MKKLRYVVIFLTIFSLIIIGYNNINNHQISDINKSFFGSLATNKSSLLSNKSINVPKIILNKVLNKLENFSLDLNFIQNIVYSKSSSNNIGDEQLLARTINGEARGEPYEGQVAVGAVILNRAKDPKFPKTLAGVIYQPGAFTAVSDGQINVPLDPNSTVVKAARDALNGYDPTLGCIYYWNPATATSKWIWSRQVHKKIGKHYFAK